MDTTKRDVKGAVNHVPISPLYSVNRPNETLVVKRKNSVSDLIGRLTQPTVSSRQKMRQPHRSVSSGSQPSDASSKHFAIGKRSVSHSDVVISRPIPLPKPLHPLDRSLSKDSPEVQRAIRKKAPSPPGSARSTRSSTRSTSTASTHSESPKSLNQVPIKSQRLQLLSEKQTPPTGRDDIDNNTNNSDQNSNGSIHSPTGSEISFKDYGTPSLQNSSQVGFPVPPHKKFSKNRDTNEYGAPSGDPRSPNLSSPAQLSGKLVPRIDTRLALAFNKHPPQNPLGIRIAPIPTRSASSASPVSPGVNNKILPLSMPNKPPQTSHFQPKRIDMNASSYLGHHRRLSAPAPFNNVTTPRAMSHIKGGASPPSPLYSHKKHASITESIDSTTSYPEEKTPLSSLSPSPEFKKSPLSPTGTHTTTDAETPDQLSTPGDSTHTLKQKEEMVETMEELREQNKRLKVSNKLLKEQVDSLQSSQDELTVELAISEASRNSLSHQVKGYESVQRGLEKKIGSYRKDLARSRAKVTQLQLMVQELKISLEERNMENYALSYKRAIGRANGNK